MSQSTNRTLSDFLEDVYFLERDLLPGSKRQLRMSVQAFEQFAGKLTIDQLSHAQLNRWIAENPHRWKPKTLRRRVFDVLGIWTHCYRIGETENEPNRLRIRAIRVPRKIPHAWTLDELRAMYDAAGTFRRYLPNGVQQGDLLRAMINVGFHTALRAGDLMTLRRVDLSPKGRPVGQAKKRGAQVVVSVPEYVIGEINRRYPDEVERVWAWPHRREHFYELWRKMLEAAGLPAGREHGLQKLRRTSVTTAESIKRGWGARIAGHEPGSRVTYQSYVDPTLLEQDETLTLPAIRQPNGKPPAAPASPATTDAPSSVPHIEQSPPAKGPPRHTPAADCRTLREIWDAEYRPALLSRASEEALQLWRFVFGQLRTFLDTEATLVNLTDECIARFRDWRHEKCGDATTANRDLAIVLALWQFCYRQGIAARWPTVEPLPEPTHLPRGWSHSEFTRLLAHIDTLEGRYGIYAARDFWRSLVLVLCDGGQRLSSVLELRWCDVDTAGRSLHFPACSGTKFGVDNTVAVPARTIESLERMRVLDDGRMLMTGKVFPVPCSLPMLYRQFRQILQAAGIDGDGRSFDELRRAT